MCRNPLLSNHQGWNALSVLPSRSDRSAGREVRRSCAIVKDDLYRRDRVSRRMVARPAHCIAGRPIPVERAGTSLQGRVCPSPTRRVALKRAGAKPEGTARPKRRPKQGDQPGHGDMLVQRCRVQGATCRTRYTWCLITPGHTWSSQWEAR